MEKERKILVYDSKGYTRSSFEEINHDGLTFTYIDSNLNKNTAYLAKDFDSVVCFVNDDINKDTLKILDKVGINAIFLRCSGFNNIDLSFAYKKIKVYRVPVYSPNSIAEHAFALLLTSNRRIHKAYNRTKEFNFSLEDLVGMELKGKTLGIIGTGKIGRCMIDIANGFKMKVIAYDPYPIDNPTTFKYVSLDYLLSSSDIISLHCPLTEETKHILNKEAFEKMKKGVIIINTSRGGLIDSIALLDSIKSRKVSAACLDVYEEETDIFFVDRSNHILDDEVLRDLISMPNVIVTSHQAFLTKEALKNIAKVTIDNIRMYFEDNPNVDNEVCYKCPNR